MKDVVLPLAVGGLVVGLIGSIVQGDKATASLCVAGLTAALPGYRSAPSGERVGTPLGAPQEDQ